MLRTLSNDRNLKGKHREMPLRSHHVKKSILSQSRGAKDIGVKAYQGASHTVERRTCHVIKVFNTKNCIFSGNVLLFFALMVNHDIEIFRLNNESHV